jgi:hypothetical protein
MSVYERTDVDYERADEVTDLEHGARLHVCQNRVMGCIEQLGDLGRKVANSPRLFITKSGF